MKKANKLIIRSNLAPLDFKSDYETINGDSLTVPGEAYTIDELYQRANGGIPVETLVHVRETNYSDTEDYDDVNPTSDPAFDLVDAENLIRESEDTITAAKGAASKKPTPNKKTTKEPEPPKESSEADDPKGDSD